MNFTFIKIFVLLLVLPTCALATEIKIILGSDLKKAAQGFLEQSGVSNDIIISESRAFFPCSNNINIAPQRAGDWSTLKATCSDPAGWSVSIRTKPKMATDLFEPGQVQTSIIKVVYANRNIPKGHVIQMADLMLGPADQRTAMGAYLKFDDIIGHESKRNLSRNTVLKVRHIVAASAVDKDDTILIVSNATGLQITAYGEALADGKIGDMILVRSLSSGKQFKATIIAEKKVSPITNIN